MFMITSFFAVYFELVHQVLYSHQTVVVGGDGGDPYGGDGVV